MNPTDDQLLEGFENSEVEKQDSDESLIHSYNAELTPEEQASIESDVNLQKKYGRNSAEAALLGAGRGLTFGLSDQALVKSGVYTPEELDEIKKRNEISSLTGELGATAASLLATGGTGITAKAAQTAGKGVIGVSKAAQAAEKLTEKAFAAAIAQEGKKSLVKNIVQKTIPKIVGSSVEGAAYGLGQLVSEDALGNAELNAESALASAGTGAMLGAVAGGLFEAPKALLPIVKKGTKPLQGKVSKLSNPTDAALDIYGVAPAARTKLQKTSGKFVEELPEWTVNKAKLGYFTGSGKLKDNVLKIKEEAGESIGNIMSKIDDLSEINPSILPDNQSTYAGIAKKLDDTIIKKYESVPGYKSQLRPVMELRDDFIKLAKVPGNVKAGEIHGLRMDVDKLIKFDKAPGTYTLKESALNDVRGFLNDEIQTIAQKADALDSQKQFGSLFKSLLESNKDFSYASKILPFIEKKVDREAAKRGIFNLTDLVTGGLAIQSLGDIGGAIVGAKKLIESDIRRRATLLSYAERQSKTVDSKIKSGINSFFNSAEKAIKPIKSTASKALINSSMSIKEGEKKKPENKKEAFENIKENISNLISNPEALQTKLERRTLHLNSIMPNISQQAIQTAIKGLQFLASKLPKPAQENDIKNMFSKRKWSPSEVQLSKFERYLEAVENPLSAIEDLQKGTLTREAAEAIKFVYPKIFEKMQQQVIDKISDPNVKINYSNRIQLGILLDLPTDYSLDPKNIAALQANLAFSQEQPKATPYRADKLNFADRTETKQNQIAQR